MCIKIKFKHKLTCDDGCKFSDEKKGKYMNNTIKIHILYMHESSNCLLYITYPIANALLLNVYV